MREIDFRQKAWSAGLIVLFFFGWELFCLMTGMSDLVLPRPSQIIATLVTKFPVLWPHIIQTVATTMAGFVLGVALGVVLGAIIGVSKTAYDTAYPLLVGFSSILKVAISYAFVGAVLSETVASNRGIGNVMMTASSNFNVPLVFAGLFVLAALGVALYAVFAIIEKRVTGWATRKNDLIAT